MKVDTYPPPTHIHKQTFSEVKAEGAIKLKVQLPISVCREIHDPQQLPKSMAATCLIVGSSYSWSHICEFNEWHIF